MPKSLVNPLDRLFAALADGTRREVLARLAKEGDVTIAALAAPFDMALPSFSQHLDVLERADLISRTKVGRERHVTFEAKSLAPAKAWLNGIDPEVSALPPAEE